MRKKKEPTPFVPKRTLSLKEIRTNVFNMTLTEFAELIGTKRSTYWFWEQNKKKMPGVFVGRIKELMDKKQTPQMTQDPGASA
jgi:DNA-binding transcriptional regulator YiaG